jgi:hypothetical protein
VIEMRRRSRAFSIVVPALMVCLFAAVGLRAGQIVRPSPADAAGTWQSAAAAGYSHAHSSAYRAAWRAAYRQGWASGATAGSAAGARAGRVAGRARAALRAAAISTLRAILTHAPRTLSRSVKTERCVPVGGGLCEVLGPRVTRRRCPPASTPYVEGGAVCVPRVLQLLAHNDR